MCASNASGNGNIPFHGCDISWFLFELSVSVLSVKLLRLIRSTIFFWPQDQHTGLFVDTLHAVIYRNDQELSVDFTDKVSRFCPNIHCLPG